MKIVFAVVITFAITSGFFLYLRYQENHYLSPIGQGTIKPREKLLAKYTYRALQKANYPPSAITLTDRLQKQDNFTSYLFFFNVDGKKVSGLANIPTRQGEYPVVVLIRGYVAKEIYQTGVGTQRVGEALANAGFITLAPDFLGYGKSDWSASEPLEERFQTYTTVLTLLQSIPNLSTPLAKINPPAGGQITVNSEEIGIWGHSNGGQIALSVLEISGKPYPTVLWAPVSKPFPYSILYYTDDVDDHGKALRKLVSNFEKDYDAEAYSLTNYLDWIKGPIQLHQGLNDEAVPVAWSDLLAKTLKNKNITTEYFTYENADHNLMPSGWSSAVEKSIEFYKEKLNK